MPASSPDIFAVSVGGQFLVYAPRLPLVALIDRRAAQQLRAGLTTGAPVPAVLQSILDRLRSPGAPAPAPRTGPLDRPLFLGLIPTRGCNLACRYCDFAAPKQTSPVMSLELARAAVDAYLDLVRSSGGRQAAVHFFGGEPFFAETVVHFAVEHAMRRAAELGLTVRFEVATNGVYPAARCEWIADHFDTVVLSLDGPAEIHNRQRPALNGRGTFAVVARSARILSDGPAELIVRACVTNESLERMPETARWIAREFRPAAVCFETLVPSPLSRAAGLAPPDPWEFARRFEAAASILEVDGIEAVLSTTDLHACRLSFCPVGQDALIVSPDGAVDACYLLPDDWARRGLDLRLGRLNGRGFEIDARALERTRRLTVEARPLCADCLCRYHCAGGCHVNHPASAGPFDDVCLQTRLVTVAGLLRQLGQGALARAWLTDRPALEAAVRQLSDRLCDEELRL